jgi:CTP synthase (UTP-ammonia lyase)
MSAELQLVAQDWDGVMRPNTRTVAITARQKVHFVYGQQDLLHRHRQQFILQHRYAQGSEFPVALG